MSTFLVDPTKKVDFRFGFSIENYAKIKKFRSIGAMKLFLWSFENAVFSRNIGLSHITRNLGENFPPDFNLYQWKTLMFLVEDCGG